MWWPYCSYKRYRLFDWNNQHLLIELKLYENVSPLGIKPPVNLALSGIVPMDRTDQYSMGLHHPALFSVELLLTKSTPNRWYKHKKSAMSHQTQLYLLIVWGLNLHPAHDCWSPQTNPLPEALQLNSHYYSHVHTSDNLTIILVSIEEYNLESLTLISCCLYRKRRMFWISVLRLQVLLPGTKVWQLIFTDESI